MSTTEPAAAVWPWPRFFRYVYAAKFLCGELKRTAAAQEGPVEPGSYATAINVHNPHGYPVGMRKKAILLYDGSHPEEAVERPVPPVHHRCPVMEELSPDYGLEIDCRDVREVLLAAAPGRPAPRPDLHQGLGRGRDARRRPARRRRRLRPQLGPKSEPQPVSIDTGGSQATASFSRASRAPGSSRRRALASSASVVTVRQLRVVATTASCFSKKAFVSLDLP